MPVNHMIYPRSECQACREPAQAPSAAALPLLNQLYTHDKLQQALLTGSNCRYRAYSGHFFPRS
jgi:hypothetical protein